MNDNRRTVLGDLLAARAALGADGGSAAANAEAASGKPLRKSLVGAWRLVSCVEVDAKTGEVYLPFGGVPEGLILYTPDGYMSAQLSAAGRRKFASGDMYQGKAEEYVNAGLTYLAYSASITSMRPSGSSSRRCS
jgi:Lipocalin-like domain